MLFINLMSGEYFGAKGTNYIKINKTMDRRCKYYHIMITHIQAGCGEFLDGLAIPEYEPFILMGDIILITGGKETTFK